MNQKLKEIVSRVKIIYELAGNGDLNFTSLDPISEAKEGSLSWITSNHSAAESIIRNTKASVIICDKNLPLNEDLFSTKCFIIVDKPRLFFLRIVNLLYGNDPPKGQFIHPSAIIHTEAEIGENVFIGEFCIINKCKIGDGSVIKSFSKIHDNVFIGKNVTIHEHCNIGGQGFGFELNEENIPEHILHIGKVEIGDNVEIFPFCNVDKATLSVTKIGLNTKIDHYCHIGHNTTVGINSLITANTTLCGGSRVGNNTFIGVGTIIRDPVLVGNNVFIGMGSIVTKNIPDGEKWAGNPARPLDELKELNKKLNKL